MDATFPDLAGRSIFITGGASGIGAALVEGFARQGARVAFVDLLDGEAFAAEVAGRTGAEVLGMQCDITDTAALEAAMDRAAAAHGPIAVLVNNAADDTRHDALDVTEAAWDAVQAVNLRAYFMACRKAAEGMAAMGGGTIVNFSSITYMMGFTGIVAYVSANAGIVGMTRALAREWGPKGIRVNALAPGWVLTERQIALWAKPEALAAHIERQCLKEPLYPADIVGPTLFLASAASRMVAGQVLAVDGGVVATG